MSGVENLKELLNDYRNSVKSDLDKDELQEVDKYIKKVVEDIGPFLSLTSALAKDEEQLKIMKEYLDDTIKEEKWLEKLLKTS
tara:strand:+ start:318 stop:566 length:249 start_codon:yes stop_codon:yes gene_type:complete